VEFFEQLQLVLDAEVVGLLQFLICWLEEVLMGGDDVGGLF
jgi:hypothetical protein